MKLSLAAIFIALVCSVRAATITAASPSRADVATAYAACSDGDILHIPAGAANWTTQLAVSKAITIEGSGVGQTYLTNAVGNYMFDVTLVASKTNRFTAIDFQITGTFACINCLGANTDARRLIVDNCHFNGDYSGGTGGALKLDTVLGVFHHNTMQCTAPGNKLAHVKCSVWNGLIRGNGAWTNATALFGTENFFFFEDNFFQTTNVFLTSLIDAQAGGRYVFRYNTNWGPVYVEGHGSEASYERSTHAIEIYKNIWRGSNLNQIVTFMRGGGQLIYSNDISDYIASSVFKLENNRMNDFLFSPYGGADGRNHWDSNSVSNPFATGTASSAGTLTVTVTGAGWGVNSWVGYTIRATSGKTVSSMTRSGTIVTVNSTGHGFSNGDYISIFGADQQEYNGTWIISGVAADSFQFDTLGPLPTSPATGTIKARLKDYFAEISANTSDTITFHDSIYGSSHSLTFAGSDTFEINLVVRAMDQVGWIGGAELDSTATPAFPASWNNQVNFPAYQWSNHVGGISAPVFSPSSARIIAGRDFTNNFPLAGYTPFSYPWTANLAGPLNSAKQDKSRGSKRK